MGDLDLAQAGGSIIAALEMPAGEQAGGVSLGKVDTEVGIVVKQDGADGIADAEQPAEAATAVANIRGVIRVVFAGELAVEAVAVVDIGATSPGAALELAAGVVAVLGRLACGVGLAEQGAAGFMVAPGGGAGRARGGWPGGAVPAGGLLVGLEGGALVVAVIAVFERVAGIAPLADEVATQVIAVAGGLGFTA